MFSREGIYKGRIPLFVHGGFAREASPCSYEGVSRLDHVQPGIVADQEAL